MKSGFIAILGRPNVGKSSLMNALIGEKVAIVSPKAQTTRNRAHGILTENDYQIIFVDTPGVHKPKNKLGAYMNKCIAVASEDVDAIVIVLDVSKPIRDTDIEFIEKHLRSDTPVILVLNKVDVVNYEKVYPILSRLNYLTQADGSRRAIKDIIPLSAKKQKNVDVLKKVLLELIPEGPFYYPSDEITDKSERYMISEIVREKALLLLGDEIPHGIGVTIQNMFYDEHKTAHIAIDIVAEKSTHKSIIIGKNGEMLKAIAERARKDVERLLDSKVYMEMFVKIREDWRNDTLVMNDIGYNPKKV